jgi:hypothetical protein
MYGGGPSGAASRRVRRHPRRHLGHRSLRTGPPVRRPWLDRKPAPAPRSAVLPRDRQDRPATGGRRRARRPDAQAPAPAGGEPRRCVVTAQQRVPEPAGDQGHHRHPRGEPGPRSEGARERRVATTARPEHGGHQWLRSRDHHRRHPGRRGLPDPGVRADPVRRADRRGTRDADLDDAADDQQVLRARPRPRPQRGGTPRPAGPAGLHALVAQPHGAARGMEPRHVCARRPRGVRRRAGGDPVAHSRPSRHLLRRDHRLDGGGVPVLCRPGRRTGCAHPPRHGSRPGRGGYDERVTRPPPCPLGVRDVTSQGLLGRRRAGRGVRLAEARRPDLELLGEQLSAREEASGLRRAVLER